MHDRQRQSLTLVIEVIVNLTKSTLNLIRIYIQSLQAAFGRYSCMSKRMRQHKAGSPAPECFRLVLIDWKHLHVTGYTFETGALKLWRKVAACSMPLGQMENRRMENIKKECFLFNVKVWQV